LESNIQRGNSNYLRREVLREIGTWQPRFALKGKFLHLAYEYDQHSFMGGRRMDTKSKIGVNLVKIASI